MHVIAWLLTQRAWQKGEITTDALSDPKYRLGVAARTETSVLMTLPPCARELVINSQALYDRVLRLQEQMLRYETPAEVAEDALPEAPVAGPGPARDLLKRLEQAF
jgi:regulator of CtrA degradation